MTGKDLLLKIRSFNYKNAELAALLGISEQALNSKLKTTDVKVSFILELAEKTNKTVYEWLTIPEPPVVNDNSQGYNSYKSKYLDLLEEYKRLSDRLADCLESKIK